mgnify:CR=1 FL=1
MKPIYTLGICNDETSSACLFKDGELVSAASEERFSRIKLDNTFPQQAINFVLSHSNICFNDLTNIAYSWAKGFNESLLPNYIKRSELSLESRSEAYSIFLDRINWDIKKDRAGRDKYITWIKKQNLKNIKVNGRDSKNLPPYASKIANTIEKNRMIFLVPWAIALLLVFTNQFSIK